jgi:UrcA family protein
MSFQQQSIGSRASVIRRVTARQAAVFAAVLGTLSWYAAVPAQAADALQTTIEYGDLNLSNERDVNRLYARLQRASNRVCQRNNGREHYQRRLFKECYVETLARAVSGINAVQLTKLHAARDAGVAQRNRPS